MAGFPKGKPMISNPLRDVLVEWLAVACAATVFVAAALDTPQSAVPAKAVSSAAANPAR
ncbi:MAG: hypothetical protein ACXWCU_07365 [Caldimonas sp.]